MIIRWLAERRLRSGPQFLKIVPGTWNDKSFQLEWFFVPGRVSESTAVEFRVVAVCDEAIDRVQRFWMY